MFNTSQPSDCDRFSKCDAPICPLDGNWEDRVMIQNEAICRYLKDALRGRFLCTYPDNWDSGVVGAILDKYPHVGTRILRL
jgi:hypothetical protein